MSNVKMSKGQKVRAYCYNCLMFDVLSIAFLPQLFSALWFWFLAEDR